MVRTGRLRQVEDTAELIRNDAENDGFSIDGTPVTGRNLGPIFGKLFAMVNALARNQAILARELRKDHE